jgi:hypothetical protein
MFSSERNDADLSKMGSSFSEQALKTVVMTVAASK